METMLEHTQGKQQEKENFDRRCGRTEEECPPVQMKSESAGDGILPNQPNIFRSFLDSKLKSAPVQMKREDGGNLPDELKTAIEAKSGIGMDDVRVHYNSSRPQELDALAYTQGSDIHIAPGQEKHLAHEAWHVVQQKQGRVKPTGTVGGENLNDDDALEHEADMMGNRFVATTDSDGEVKQCKSADGDCVQRMPAHESITELGTPTKGEATWNGSDTLYSFNISAQSVDKAAAIKAISEKAAEIAVQTRGINWGSGPYRVNPFCLKISNTYKTRGLSNKAKRIVKLALTYHYGYNFEGYVVGVDKTGSKTGRGITPRRAMMYAGNDRKQYYDAYSNLHEHSFDASVLGHTYRVKSNDNVLSYNYDAYTKLAGEGARFQCVRENIGTISDNTVFYVTGQTRGIRFSDLWRTWKSVFGKRYNISNSDVSSALSGNPDLLVNERYQQITLVDVEGAPSKVALPPAGAPAAQPGVPPAPAAQPGVPPAPAAQPGVPPTPAAQPGVPQSQNQTAQQPTATPKIVDVEEKPVNAMPDKTPDKSDTVTMPDAAPMPAVTMPDTTEEHEPIKEEKIEEQLESQTDEQLEEPNAKKKRK